MTISEEIINLVKIKWVFEKNRMGYKYRSVADKVVLTPKQKERRVEAVKAWICGKSIWIKSYSATNANSYWTVMKDI